MDALMSNDCYSITTDCLLLRFRMLLSRTNTNTTVPDWTVGEKKNGEGNIINENSAVYLTK